LNGYISGERRVIVLKGKSNGDYKLMSQSLTWELNSNRVESLEIENSSLFFHTNGSGCCWSNEMQFKFKKGHFVLIGYTYFDAKNQEEPDDNGQSINLLTHKKIRWFRDKKGYKETASKITPRPLLTLEKFSLDSYEDHFDKNTFY
jgi:hypothetical protein